MLDIVRESKLIRRITKRVYYSTRFSRMRQAIEEEDLYQMVMLKLLHRENYKIYSDKYSLPGFIYRVANGVAITFNSSRQNTNEITLLDSPVDTDGNPNQLLSELTYDSDYDEIALDVEKRIVAIKEGMDPSIICDLEIRNEGKATPFSLREMFKYFVSQKCTKNEMRKHIVYRYNKAQVPNYVFDNYWDHMSSRAYDIMESL